MRKTIWENLRRKILHPEQKKSEKFGILNKKNTWGKIASKNKRKSLGNFKKNCKKTKKTYRRACLRHRTRGGAAAAPLEGAAARQRGARRRGRRARRRWERATGRQRGARRHPPGRSPTLVGSGTGWAPLPGSIQRKAKDKETKEKRRKGKGEERVWGIHRKFLNLRSIAYSASRPAAIVRVNRLKGHVWLKSLLPPFQTISHSKYLGESNYFKIWPKL